MSRTFVPFVLLLIRGTTQETPSAINVSPAVVPAQPTPAPASNPLQALALMSLMGGQNLDPVQKLLTMNMVQGTGSATGSGSGLNQIAMLSMLGQNYGGAGAKSSMAKYLPLLLAGGLGTQTQPSFKSAPSEGVSSVLPLLLLNKLNQPDDSDASSSSAKGTGLPSFSGLGQNLAPFYGPLGMYGMGSPSFGQLPGQGQVYGPMATMGQPFGLGQGYGQGQPFGLGQGYGQGQPFGPAQSYGQMGQPFGPVQSYGQMGQNSGQVGQSYGQMPRDYPYDMYSSLPPYSSDNYGSYPPAAYIPPQIINLPIQQDSATALSVNPIPQGLPVQRYYVSDQPAPQVYQRDKFPSATPVFDIAIPATQLTASSPYPIETYDSRQGQLQIRPSGYPEQFHTVVSAQTNRVPGNSNPRADSPPFIRGPPTRVELPTNPPSTWKGKA